MSKPMLLNTDWLFHLGDEPAADFMGYDDSAWKRVTLPHDWSVEHPFDTCHASGTGYLPGGTAWYRKHFTLPQSASGQRVRVTFGGVYKHSQVWINSNYLGKRPYGYATFTHDITAFVRPGENVLCVRVEHNETADSRWFTGSGIYRDVTLEISDPICFAENGIFAVTHSADAEKAEVSVRYETLGGDGAAFSLTDTSGNTVATGEASGETGEMRLTIAAPQLWSPDTPALYTLTGSVLKGGRVTDARDVRIGLRTLRFDGDTGFYLNGQAMKLKGVCVHHDAGALGAAVPKAVWERRLRRFKAAGVNALRTAHNPPDSHLLDLCDELGLLVMDEAFDEWEGAKNKWWRGHNVYPPKRFGYAEDFPQWHKADLEGMVRRDRNHPSVILWSIGNEIDYPNDPYVTPLFKEVLGNNDANKPAAERMYDARKPDASRLAVLARELTEIVHSVDSTRPVTSAMSFPELSTRTGFADALDVSGYNYREKFYEEDHRRFPGRVIYGSENSHDVEAWKYVRDNAYICGQFLWTGVDFLGECPGWPIRISRAGMMDLAGNPKPLYYMRQAMWTDTPCIKLAAGGEKPWEQRLVWAGVSGERQTVAAYTNQAEAELFFNGKSLGRKPATDYCVTWEVPYADGELRVVAGEAEDVLCTAGKAVRLALTPDKTALCADQQDVAQIEVSLLDTEGRFVSNDEVVTYQVLGDAKILGVENGRPDDLTCYAEPYRATQYGKAIVYLRAGKLPGVITLHAFTRSGLTADATLQSRRA